jgi:glycosyltransferase involved in cell wall biosynthesis
MKIIHIFNSLKFSGAEIMYVDAASIFQSLGCELTAVATANELGEFVNNFKNAGFTIYHKPYPNRFNFAKRFLYHLKFIRFLRRNNYDLIHLHSLNLLLGGFAFFAWIAKIKCVYTFHNVYPTNWYSFNYHKMQRFLARNIYGCRFQTISDSVFNHELSLYNNQTTKIYNWYNDSRFYPAKNDEKYSIRKKLGIDQDTLVLISVGGCSDVKRHSDIIKALPSIKNKLNKVLYLHLGTGLIENEELNLSKNLKVDENVLFLGNQYGVRDFLVASDIYLMVSKFEGIPISTIEAMGCNIPSILYDVPGLRDFNSENKCSILINESIEQLSNTIIELHYNKKLAQVISENALLLVSKRYNMRNNCNDIFELYKK